MTTFTTHLKRRGLRATVAPLLLAALFATATSGVHSGAAHASATAAGRSYGWPVAPFNRQHPIRGGFGDPRTLYFEPPTRSTLMHPTGSFSFHQGVDISAPDGTAVYPVADGTVMSLNADRVFVSSGNGDRFEYWHIAPTVKLGQQVTIDRTVLGHIIRGSGHVHLTEVDHGVVTDPLLPGHLTPYRDTTKPEVTAIELRTSDESPAAMVNFVRGSVSIVAEAYDTPTVPVPGEWADMPMTPALITWHLETWNGKIKISEQVAWDTRQTIPSNAFFWRSYAKGTFQNMSVFGQHYSWGQPGCFRFRLGTLNTLKLADNVYRLVVTAADVRGNRSSSSIRFSVHNHAGWVGV
ncbi:MAG TPA: M23 family metallopeptidase [Gaiellaceae bacterium]|nr:M23 family metallopeptidase [Gaiellaceae bacterium]